VSSAFTNVVAISGVVNLLRDFFGEGGWNPLELRDLADYFFSLYSFTQRTPSSKPLRHDVDRTILLHSSSQSPAYPQTNTVNSPALA
ncbi:hypothetical protein, partial [Coleofasciculus sp.]|uniref:hypothetical protein n=1 Tax=Coleofasciculus sp. TaxID=3100458 RepID=UPI003A1E4D97